MSRSGQDRQGRERRAARAMLGLLFAVAAASSPWWLTNGIFLPITQRIANFSENMLLPVTGQVSADGGKTEAVSAEVVVEPTTTTTVTTSAPTTTTTTASTSTSNAASNTLRPVKETRIGGGSESGGIYVRNGAGYDLDIKGALSTPADCKILTNAGYQVLIIHTHTTEAYAQNDSDVYDVGYSPRTTDKSQNMVAVGDVVAERLEEVGISTLHVTTIHDYPQYNGSYDRALETIQTYLEKYPSIEMVIDIHRDSITADDGTKTKPTVEVNGKKAAQIMIITGCDNNGRLYFPNWQKNLRMAAQLQRQLTGDWEGLMRPLYFAPFRYNMHLTPNSLLVEFGTDVNTLDEALYSADMFGQSLAKLLLNYEV